MDMEISDVGDVRKVQLTGRLDTSAVLGIETQFVTAIVPGGKNAIVDLSQVDFVSSMGIRMFISVAQILKDKRVKLAFYAPQRMVNDVLETIAFRNIAPVCANAAEAMAMVQVQP
jgi:anti-sigma B factor antagonist